MGELAIGQERAAGAFTRMAHSWLLLLVNLAGTLGAVWLTFLIGGALLFSGRPQPTPFALYPGLALVLLLVPMLVSIILRLLGKGRWVVVVSQAALLLGNGLFWLSFLWEFTI
ncbi:hypothetical protein CU669_18475 [Paramagnetospirillum kuznetsovii]|uniref:Uncharacterized protein n=1 Tax=Paramagnetospirillum kuznetsovii TaxID=2053833 RepID=A0A364NU83_9PROT|nr:hypothetical protein [Paramagnetospirillum kuznetsovii]RAU20437.1 hypothetical protein CU669_18475 [Paramagnetospirillum kuznetsovii]